jgi:hypothetical protein
MLKVGQLCLTTSTTCYIGTTKRSSTLYLGCVMLPLMYHVRLAIVKLADNEAMNVQIAGVWGNVTTALSSSSKLKYFIVWVT